jgi:hypothetical protein
MFRLSGVSGRLAPVLARAFIVLAVLVAFSWITMAAEPNQDQPKQAEKAPVPYDKDLARAEAVVRAQYRAECDKLALKLLQEGLAQKDPKRRFVLLRRARDLAMHAGNLDTALAAVEALAKHYDIDTLKMKLAILVWYAVDVLEMDSLLLIGPAEITDGSRRREVATTALLVSECALAKGKYARALRFVSFADAALREEGSDARDAAFRWRGQTLAQVRSEYLRLAAVAKKLASSPKDPEANLVLGKFLCLEIGYLKEGLPRLALGGDPALKALAVKELGRITGARAGAALGDAWWDLAEKATGRQRLVMRDLALRWYTRVDFQEALKPALTSADKKRIEKRVAEINRARADAKLGTYPLIMSTPAHDVPEGEEEIRFDKRADEIAVPAGRGPMDPIGIRVPHEDPLPGLSARAGPGHGSPKGPLSGGFGAGGNKPARAFAARTAALKQKAIQDGGGSQASEAAVALGLQWIARHQASDGHWSLGRFHWDARCNCANPGSHQNDVAATAFGLLPLLGAGYTHKVARDNPYQKNVLAGLNFLIRRQHKTTGRLGEGMYAHGLATMALCEAYGLTQDPLLKPSAQAAVNYLVFAQHEEGGWRYGPHQQGDTSVTGWQVAALKTARLAGLSVPEPTMKKAQAYLDNSMSDTDYGYGYFGKGSTPSMSAVGLLCRQYLQGWGPDSPAMSKGVANWLTKDPPKDSRSMYFYYYATQVMHNIGGQQWKRWNEKMRDALIKGQDKGADSRHAHQKGSWSPVGDPFGSVGGRLMITSLSILTLEVYYRGIPLKTKEKK